MARSPKDFLRAAPRGKAATLLQQWDRLQAQFPDEDVSFNGKYERGQATVEHDGWTESDAFNNAAEDFAEKLEGWLQERASTIVHLFLEALEADYDHLTSDEGIIESLDSNDMYFDEDGEQVDLTDYVHIDQLPKEVALKVVKTYAKMFDLAEDTVFERLQANKIKFDKHGNRIDTSGFKLASEWPAQVQSKIADDHRHWNVEDNWWAESNEEFIRDQYLAGWRKPQFEWASYPWHGGIYTDSIDLREFLEQNAEREKEERQRELQQQESTASRIIGV